MAEDRQPHVYHRLESPTQTPADAARQAASGELWGRAPRTSFIPAAQAFRGPLPLGARGIEFTTDVPPDAGSPPREAYWRGPRIGVTVDAEFPQIKFVVTKNTQV